MHFPVTTLGPGQRLGIWFQGCSIRCSGCISADTWGPGRTVVDVASLLEQVAPWLHEADGITISGGEPFDQFDALLQMLVGLRQRTAADILVYSGHPLETLQPMLDQARDLIDAVISDPTLNMQPSRWRCVAATTSASPCSPRSVGRAWPAWRAPARRPTRHLT